MRYLPFVVAVAVGLGLLDYYVYRNWLNFARYRRWRVRYTAYLYRALVIVMPFSLPIYLLFFNWWEVEPKLLRALFVGFWVIYYVPKIPVAAFLLLKDAARLVSWQFGWLKRQQGPHAQNMTASDTDAPDLADLRSMTRAEFLRRMGWTAASIPFVLVGYGVLRSLYDFDVREQVVRMPHLPPALDGLRIAQLSDLHAGSFFSHRPLREVVSTVNALEPDLLTFTGDFVNHDADELREVMTQLAGLSANIGAFACLGNHDHYARVQDVVRLVGETPLTLLVNDNRSLVVNGVPIFVVGTDNTGFNQHYADLPRATRGIPERDSEDLRILLAHDPSFWDQARHERPDVDLTLSGHTHGGQVGIEFGPIRWSLARLAYPRWAGLYSESSSASQAPQFLYVNRGLGTVGPPIRIGIRPEITVLTLQRGHQSA